MRSSIGARSRLPLCVAIIGFVGASGCAVEPGGDGSHAIVYYNVGDWFFERCEEPATD